MSITRADRGLKAARTYLVAMAATLLALALVASVGTGPAKAATTQQAADAQVRIAAPQAFPAPTDKPGGVRSPLATCGTDGMEPTTTWTLRNRKAGWAQSWHWTGSLPGRYFPRVEAGRYESTTVATCGDVTLESTHELRVKEKTRAGTVSKGEWKKIRKGMTRAKVKAIVGSNGRDASTVGKKTTVTYDMMPFYRWSHVVYRNGKVVDKEWNVAHD